MQQLQQTRDTRTNPANNPQKFRKQAQHSASAWVQLALPLPIIPKWERLKKSEEM
jgi:hypothetical protein